MYVYFSPILPIGMSR